MLALIWLVYQYNISTSISTESNLLNDLLQSFAQACFAEEEEKPFSEIHWGKSIDCRRPLVDFGSWFPASGPSFRQPLDSSQAGDQRRGRGRPVACRGVAGATEREETEEDRLFSTPSREAQGLGSTHDLCYVGSIRYL